jgi:RimJ/RimL family protein N-acetyltransferase
MIDTANYVQTETLKSGVSIEIRSIRSGDKGSVTEAFHNLEPESIYTRFFYQKKDLSENELKTITEVDFENVVALVVTVTEEMNKVIIAGGRYFVLDETETLRSAELAFMVEEDYHGQGIAGILLKHLIRIGRYKGLARFEAEVLSENKAMLKVFSRSGLPMKEKRQGGVTHVTLGLKEDTT